VVEGQLTVWHQDGGDFATLFSEQDDFNAYYRQWDKVGFSYHSRNPTQDVPYLTSRMTQRRIRW
jgi:hypothetical protein